VKPVIPSLRPNASRRFISRRIISAASFHLIIHVSNCGIATKVDLQCREKCAKPNHHLTSQSKILLVQVELTLTLPGVRTGSLTRMSIKSAIRLATSTARVFGMDMDRTSHRFKYADPRRKFFVLSAWFLQMTVEIYYGCSLCGSRHWTQTSELALVPRAPGQGVAWG
jgi:hypothetical protein